MAETFEEQVNAAEELVLTSQFASTSMLQRKMRISYVRAAAVMEELELRGVVGPQEDARTRPVLKSPPTAPDYEEMTRRNLGAFYDRAAAAAVQEDRAQQ